MREKAFRLLAALRDTFPGRTVLGLEVPPGYRRDGPDVRARERRSLPMYRGIESAW